MIDPVYFHSFKNHHMSSIQIRLPFNWKRPLPYFFLMSSQMMSAYFIQGVYVATSSLFTGVCFILVAFNVDIRKNLRAFNRLIIAKKREEEEMKRKGCQKNFTNRKFEMKKKVLEIIEFHAQVRQ